MQEAEAEPPEINVLLPLATLIFCGLPILALGGLFWFLIKRIQKRAAAFPRQIIKQEVQKAEDKTSRDQ